MLIAVEGGPMIHDSLATLRAYAQLGARSMTLTHFVNTSWADSSSEKPAHNGLTDFGKEVVREMNRLGVIVDHIDHAVKLVGADHVGIGSDFDGAPMPEGMEDASHLPRITEELLRRGYSEADIKKILGGNTLRLLEEVEAVSKKLRAQATS